MNGGAPHDAAVADPVLLTVVASAGLVLLLFLIIGKRMHAFVALLLVSLLIGLAAQWPRFEPDLVLRAMQEGMGGTLGFVAVVVGLGAIFGRLLEVSGGARVLADGLLASFRMERAGWALGIAGFLISIPVFFDVALVVLVPMLYGLARRSGAPLMRFALPLLAGMVVTHAFVPPTPGPIGVAAIVNAELGLVIVFGIVAGLPGMMLAGPLLAKVIDDRIPGRLPETVTSLEGGAPPMPREPAGVAEPERPPSFGLVLGLLASPIFLILSSTLAHAWFGGSEGGKFLGLLALVGHPFVALMITTLVSFRVLGARRGLSAEQVRDLATGALEPAGIIILVTGAGGVLKQVMIQSQVGSVLADQLSALGVAPLLLAFLLAWVVRVMQGSATVAMLTAAGLIVPLIEPLSPSEVTRALVVISIASGATCTSHVNDSGFWLVSRYLGLTTHETLRSWTLMTTLVGLVGLVVVLLLGWVWG